MNRYKETTYPMLPLMRRLHADGQLTPEQAVLLAPTRPREELYDVLADPYETHNLAADPAYQEVLVQLRGEVDRWIEAIDDQGRFPEDPAVPAYYEQRMRETYQAELDSIWTRWGLR